MLAKTSGLFRLTRDSELKYTQNGTALLKLGLVCSEKYKGKETTLFIDGTIFGKPAEIINQYAGSKGTQIMLSGKLQTEQWVDKDNQKKSKISMVIEGFDFVSNRSNNDNQQPQQQQVYQPPQTHYQNAQGQTQTQQQYQQQQQNVIPADIIPPIEIEDDEIPF